MGSLMTVAVLVTASVPTRYWSHARLTPLLATLPLATPVSANTTSTAAGLSATPDCVSSVAPFEPVVLALTTRRMVDAVPLAGADGSTTGSERTNTYLHWSSPRAPMNVVAASPAYAGVVIVDEQAAAETYSVKFCMSNASARPWMLTTGTGWVLSAAMRKSCAPLLVLVTRNTVYTPVSVGLVTVAALSVSSAMNMIRLSTLKVVGAPKPAPEPGV